jgi:site-specific recombinase XerD
MACPLVAANIMDRLAIPKAARHAFGVNAVQNSVVLNIVQRWMGHARIETAAIYTDVIGEDERYLTRLHLRPTSGVE